MCWLSQPSFPPHLHSRLHHTVCATFQQPNDGVRQWPFKELQDACQQFDPAAVLGRGSFSVVYGGVSSSGQPIAVKTIDALVYRRATPGDKAACVTAFRNEIDFLRRFKHPNLVRLLGWGVESGEGRLAVVLERVHETLSARLFSGTGNGRLAPIDRYARITFGLVG